MSAVNRLGFAPPARNLHTRLEKSSHNCANQLRLTGGVLYFPSRATYDHLIHPPTLAEPRCVFPQRLGHKVQVGVHVRKVVLRTNEQNIVVEGSHETE